MTVTLKDNIMAADVLTPGIARTSAVLILTVQCEQEFVFQEEGFQLAASSQK